MSLSLLDVQKNVLGVTIYRICCTVSLFISTLRVWSQPLLGQMSFWRPWQKHYITVKHQILQLVWACLERLWLHTQGLCKIKLDKIPACMGEAVTKFHLELTCHWQLMATGGGSVSHLQGWGPWDIAHAPVDGRLHTHILATLSGVSDFWKRTIWN